jgi:hypothetical protein
VAAGSAAAIQSFAALSLLGRDDTARDSGRPQVTLKQAGDATPSGDVPTMLRAEICLAAPRLRLQALGGLLALPLCPIGLGSLSRGRRSDGGLVAGKARSTIGRHGRRSLRLRTRRLQHFQIPAALVCLWKPASAKRLFLEPPPVNEKALRRTIRRSAREGGLRLRLLAVAKTKPPGIEAVSSTPVVNRTRSIGQYGAESQVAH